jgi:threonine/homoserine/homoserine lactone efflux protein
MLGYIVQGLGYGLAAAAQPGPFQAYVISQSLTRGWRRTLPAALAPLLSDGPIIALALLLLSQVPSWFQRALNLASGAFVLYLAWGAYRSWRDFDPEGLLDGASANPGVLKAAFMNVLSPGPYLFWSLVTGPILLEGWRESPSHGIGFLGGFYGAMVGALVAMIVVFGAARQLGPKVNRALLGASALALLAFGIFQLARGIMG